MSEDRLTALETALAHAEAAIQDLSELARAQGEEIARLKRETAQLKDLVRQWREDREDGDSAFVP